MGNLEIVGAVGEVAIFFTCLLFLDPSAIGNLGFGRTETLRGHYCISLPKTTSEIWLGIQEVLKLVPRLKM